MSLKKFLIILCVLILASLGLWLFRPYQLRAPSGRTISINGVDVAVVIADTDATRVQGLSDSTPLLPQTGMLFVFDTPGKYGFWMKDMNYPIDMIWFNQNHEVVYIRSHASPASYPTVFTPADESLYVLEVPDGFVDWYHISKGVTFTIN